MNIYIKLVMILISIKLFSVDIQELYLNAPDSIFKYEMFYKTNRLKTLTNRNEEMNHDSHQKPRIEYIYDKNNGYLKIDYCRYVDSPLGSLLQTVIYNDKSNNCFYVVSEQYYHGPNRDSYFEIYEVQSNFYKNITTNIMPINYKHMILAKLLQYLSKEQSYAFTQTISQNYTVKTALYDFAYILPRYGTTILSSFNPCLFSYYQGKGHEYNLDFCSISQEIIWNTNTGRFEYGKIKEKK